MSSVGEKLRQARLEKRLTIAELATRTKVGARFLEAIETDRRDELPAGFFFKNWTLQYARVLALDQKEILDEIDRILSAEAPLLLPGQEPHRAKSWAPQRLSIRGRQGASRLWLSFGLLFLVVLGCSGFYAWWHRWKPEQSASEARSTPAPRVMPANQPFSTGAAQKQPSDGRTR